jgi:hypothetical protein
MMSRIRRVHSLILVASVGVILLIGAIMSQPSAAQTANAPGDRVPSFVQVNKRYVVRWEPGDVETYRVLEIRDGWVKAQSEAKDAPNQLVLWVNPGQAITIQELP